MTDAKPTAEQDRAISAIAAWYKDKRSAQEFLIDGEAGVGKSTTAGIALSRLNLPKISAGAQTGKAALVMRRKGFASAQTICAMLYKPKRNEETGELEWDLAEGPAARHSDLIVIDEVSMMSGRQRSDLLALGRKVLVLGDVDGQLPPIGGDSAYFGRTPDFRLLEPNRFSASSPIFQAAKLARAGQEIPFGLTERDGYRVNVQPLTKDTWREIYRPGAQVLCGTHATRWRICQLLRQHQGYSGPVPLAGERLICCRNDFKLGIVNGGFGVLSEDAEANFDPMRINIAMDDLDEELFDIRMHAYPFRQHFVGPLKVPEWQPGITEFDWCGAITVHKFQGSQEDDIVLIDESNTFRDADTRRRWLYTGITRAARSLTILRRT